MTISDQEDSNQSKSGEPVNGSFSLRVSQDQLAVYLCDLSHPINGGDAVSPEMVFAKLQKQKIITGIDKDKIKNILASLSTDFSDEELCIAQGEAPVNGEDDELTWNITEQSIQQHCAVVLPDEVIATYKEATKGKPGKNVYGKTISPRAGMSKPPVLGEGIKTSKAEAGEEYVATTLGLVAVKPGYYQTMQVDSLLQVSIDAMQAHMDIYVQTANGQAISCEHIINDLTARGITHGIDEDIIQLSLKEAVNLSSEKPLACVEHVLVAQGTQAEQGQDDELIWNIPEHYLQQGHAVVLADEIIATYHEATSGIAGTTVNGKEIKASPGASRRPSLANGLKTNKLEEGEEFVATMLGLVMVTGEMPESIQVDSLVQISEDGMAAHMDIYAQTANGQAISCEHIIHNLSANDVTHGIDEEAIQWSLKRAVNLADIKSIACVEHVLVAQGTQAEHGKDDEFVWNVPEHYLQQNCAVVLPDELIATYHQATSGTPGKTVNGTEVNATPGESKHPVIGEGIKTNEIETGEEFVAAILGLVTVKGEASEFIQVDSLLQISEDAMAAYMDIYAQTALGQEITAEHIINDLSANDVTHGIDEDTILLSLNRAANLPGDKPLACVEQVLVAKGTEIVSPRDASLILSREKDVVGAELSYGYIDFHELGYPWNVSSGDRVGYLRDSRPGVDGMTVHGVPLKVAKPREIKCKLNGLHTDESGRLFADLDGALIITGNNLTIVDLLVIGSDVGLKTGNIHSAVPVHVKGHVKPGFILECEKEVIIDQNVEDATVRAGGDIMINGGIRGKKSDIYSPSDVRVAFVENASIYLNGRLIVNGSIINSTVASNDSIIVGDEKSTKHSMVVGGEITVNKYLEVSELGSDAYTKTIVRLGVSQEDRRAILLLDKELEEINEKLERVNQTAYHHKMTPKDDTKKVMFNLAVVKKALLRKKSAIEGERNTLLEQLKQSDTGKVVIKKCVFPGVIVFIKDRFNKVNTMLGAGSFVFNKDKNSVDFIAD